MNLTLKTVSINFFLAIILTSCSLTAHNLNSPAGMKQFTKTKLNENPDIFSVKAVPTSYIKRKLEKALTQNGSKLVNEINYWRIKNKLQLDTVLGDNRTLLQSIIARQEIQDRIIVEPALGIYLNLLLEKADFRPASSLSTLFNNVTLVQGSSYNVQIGLENIGTKPETGGIALYIDGISIYSTNFSLNPGSSTATGYSWSPLAGTHTITWKADENGVISESDETNNILTRTFTVNPAPTGSPDFRPIPSLADQFNSQTLVAGTGYNLQFGAENIGPVSGTAPIAIYIDGVRQYTMSATLNPGGNIASGIVWTPTAGTHTLLWKADENNILVESDESNNNLTKIVTVNAAPTGLPDFRPLPSFATQFNNQTLVSGGFYNIQMGVENIGAVPGTSSYDLYINGIKVYNGSFTVNPGSSIATGYSWNPVAGTYNLIWKADEASTVTESDESNNNLSATVTVN